MTAKIDTLKALLLEAAANGSLTLAQIPDGDLFESVEEWAEMATDRDAEDLAIKLGLVEDNGPDIHELNRISMRNRARWAGIRGA